jgi:hypothetical protein
MTWTPAAGWPVVYMDGLAGHLYHPRTGIGPALERIRSWLAPGGEHGIATLIMSNDAPRNDAVAEPASGVAGFYWLSAEYLREQALASGFTSATTENFSYSRPHSGERVRAVVHAHVHA